MATFGIEVGRNDGVKPGNIVGAIADEANLEARRIGRIEIFDDHTLLDLPEDLPADTLAHLKKVWCGGQQLHHPRRRAARQRRQAAEPRPAADPPLLHRRQTLKGKRPFAASKPR